MTDRLGAGRRRDLRGESYPGHRGYPSVDPASIAHASDRGKPAYTVTSSLPELASGVVTPDSIVRMWATR